MSGKKGMTWSANNGVDSQKAFGVLPPQLIAAWEQSAPRQFWWSKERRHE